jgi:hypothetical protein
MKNNKVKKGGSRASNAVMALKPEVCMDYSSPVIEGKYIDYDINDLSLYRTTGGGRKRTKRGGSRASDAVMKLGGKACNQSNKALRGGAKESQLSSNYRTHSALADCNFANYESAQEQADTPNSQGVVDNLSVSGVDVSTENPTLTQTNIPLTGGGSSDWKSTLYSRGSYTAPNMPLAQFKAFANQGDYVPNDSMISAKFMKGGRSSRKQSRSSRKQSRSSRKQSRSSRKQSRSSRKQSRSSRKQRGSGKKQRGRRQMGGSDWKSTLYSRGSYIAPNMPVDQFKAFTKQANYVPNESMKTAAFMK